MFRHCLGKTQTNYVVFSWNEETVFPIWCHDIWWSILLDSSNRFIDTGLGSIPSVPFRLILSPPYWSWQLSQERTPCSWNMLGNNEPPWRQKFETWLQLFHWEKKLILDELPKSNKFEKKNMRIQKDKQNLNENRLNHFCLTKQRSRAYPGTHPFPERTRTKPILFPNAAHSFQDLRSAFPSKIRSHKDLRSFK